jgi:hypothetical protein
MPEKPEPDSSPPFPNVAWPITADRVFRTLRMATTLRDDLERARREIESLHSEIRQVRSLLGRLADVQDRTVRLLECASAPEPQAPAGASLAAGPAIARSSERQRLKPTERRSRSEGTSA